MVEQNNSSSQQEAAAGAQAQAEPDEKHGVKSLGPLELQLMSALWSSAEPLSVQGVIDGLGPGHNYKTVMTVLNRLVAKKLLERELDGRAYRYRPRRRRSEFLRSAADEIVHDYLASYGDDAAAHLAGAVGVYAAPEQPPPSPQPSSPPPFPQSPPFQASAIPPLQPEFPDPGVALRTTLAAFVLTALGLQVAITLLDLARRGLR